MSLISEALAKANNVRPVSSRPPSPKRGRWALGILLLAGAGFLWILGRPFSSPETPKIPTTAPGEPETRGSPPLQAEEPTPEDASAPALETESASTTPLPTALPAVPRVGGRWRLGGILREEGGTPLALVNGEVMEEGGTVQGAKVIRIARDGVDLESDGEIQTLTLR